MPSIKSYIHSAGAWLRYYALAKTKYQVHSPFLTEFIEKVVEPIGQSFLSIEIERRRKALFHDHRIINVDDLGAASRQLRVSQRTISRIAKTSLAPPSHCRFLQRLVHHLQPGTMLELGTSLGISTLYQQAGNPKATFYSIEGQPEIFSIAKETIEVSSLMQKPILVNGLFRDKLQTCLESLQTLDYLFIDGDHRGAHLLEYFQQVLPYLHGNSVVVIHDIHWSKDMYQAWQKLRKEQRVTVSIDLFFAGLVFLRHEQLSPLHISLIDFRYKPWSNGFFI